MMESSGAESGTFIALRIPETHPERRRANHAGRAAEQTGMRTKIPAPGRPRASRFATNLADRNGPRELPAAHLRQAVRQAAEESPAHLRKQELHHKARRPASRANHRLPPHPHWRNPNAPDAHLQRKRAPAAI